MQYYNEQYYNDSILFFYLVLFLLVILFLFFLLFFCFYLFYLYFRLFNFSLWQLQATIDEAPIILEIS